MKWFDRITFVLGKFWGVLFEESDFILSVQNLYVLWGRIQEAIYNNWRNGLTPAINKVNQDSQPFVILLDVDSIHPAHYSYADVLNGVGSLGSEKANAGFVATCRDTIQCPEMLTEHVFSKGHTLFYGLDYKYFNKEFIFYMDPRTLGLPVVKITEKDGTLKVYYRIFGRAVRKAIDYDAVVGFGSPALNTCAAVCWDMHQNGATLYNTKKLLADVTGSVVADEDGTIRHLWIENEYNCMLINDKVYMSKELPNYNHGDDVKSGDVLFGSLKMFTGKDNPPSSDVPGILVQTDCGALLAENVTKASYTEYVNGNSITILPLTSTNVEGSSLDTVAAYKNSCIEKSLDARCPSISIEASCNPYKFVMQTLRKGRGVCVRIISKDLHKLGAAIQWLRKCTCASGSVNVFVKAESEVGVPVSGFVAYAGMTAIAVDASVKIKQACAEAKVMI